MAGGAGYWLHLNPRGQELSMLHLSLCTRHWPVGSFTLDMVPKISQVVFWTVDTPCSHWISMGNVYIIFQQTLYTQPKNRSVFSYSDTFVPRILCTPPPCLRLVSKLLQWSLSDLSQISAKVKKLITPIYRSWCLRGVSPIHYNYVSERM